MSNGDMLKTIKNLVESGDDFTVKQYRVMSLTGMVELGDKIESLQGEIKQVDKSAQARVCKEVVQAGKDIERLEKKSNRNDTVVGFATVLGTIAGLIFGNK